jgi:ABC-type protease/lipase transport system fused ATPase/permease subunit
MEPIVQDALNKVMISRTTIIVVHRLSTIKGEDMIAVIKDGKVAEKGKHESLMAIGRCICISGRTTLEVSINRYAKFHYLFGTATSAL